MVQFTKAQAEYLEELKRAAAKILAQADELRAKAERVGLISEDDEVLVADEDVETVFNSLSAICGEAGQIVQDVPVVEVKGRDVFYEIEYLFPNWSAEYSKPFTSKSAAIKAAVKRVHEFRLTQTEAGRCNYNIYDNNGTRVADGGWLDDDPIGSRAYRAIY